jgi:hypothetical protein
MTRLIVVLLSIATLAFAACGDGNSDEPDATPQSTAAQGEPTPSAGGPEFGALILASQINFETKEPITQAASFPTSAPEMHATIQAKNVPAGSQFIFRWTKGTSVAATITVPVEADIADSWVAGSVRPTGAIPPGEDWLVSVSFNGVPVGSVTFVVR